MRIISFRAIALSLTIAGGTPAIAEAVQASGARHKQIHHIRGCWTHKCDVKVGRWWWRKHHPRPRFTGATYSGKATYYSEPRCDPTAGGFFGADGTHVYEGMVANSVLALGTHIWVEPAILGKHEFVVHDRFGSQQEAGRLDVWVPCGTTIPNPDETFHVIG